LQFAPLSRPELVRRTGATDLQVQAVLDELIAETFVVRRPRHPGPAAYELTADGSGRLRLLDQIEAAVAKANAQKATPARGTPPPGNAGAVRDPALEHAVLEQLGFAALTYDELVQRIPASGHAVQAALDTLVFGKYVEQFLMEAVMYRLTDSGLERLNLVRGLGYSPAAEIAFAENERRRAAVKRRRRSAPKQALSAAPLTDSERSLCSAALAEEFDAGRISEAELTRRSYDLYAAQTRADLTAVFAGLQAPDLDRTPPGSSPAPPDPAFLLRTFAKFGAVYAVAAVVIALTAHGSLLIWAVYLVVVVGNGIKAYHSWAKGEEPE
jgi:hypothetical protein